MRGRWLQTVVVVFQAVLLPWMASEGLVLHTNVVSVDQYRSTSHLIMPWQ